MDNGYYWATDVDPPHKRTMVEVLEDEVYLFGNDMSFGIKEFKDYKPVEAESGGK